MNRNFDQEIVFEYNDQQTVHALMSHEGDIPKLNIHFRILICSWQKIKITRISPLLLRWQSMKSALFFMEQIASSMMWRHKAWKYVVPRVRVDCLEMNTITHSQTVKEHCSHSSKRSSNLRHTAHLTILTYMPPLYLQLSNLITSSMRSKPAWVSTCNW